MRKIVFLTLILGAFSISAAQKCLVKVGELMENKEGIVTVEKASGAKNIMITYAPDSEIMKAVNYPFSESLTFKAERPGIVKISVRDDNGGELCSKMTSIHFDGIPISGLVIFLFAGSILLAGTVKSLKNALK